MFSIAFFEGIAYHPIVIGLLLLFFIPTVVMLKASDGVVSSSVIILHFFAAGEVTLDFVLNELAIIVIGIGMALLANLYMPSVDHKIDRLSEIKLKLTSRRSLLEIVHYLRDGDSDWDGKEIPETSQTD